MHEPLPPAVAADVPDWLWQRLGDVYGDAERAAMTQSWQTPAPLDLRANVLKTPRDAAVAALQAIYFRKGFGVQSRKLFKHIVFISTL